MHSIRIIYAVTGKKLRTCGQKSYAPSLRSFHGRHERAGCRNQALQFMAARKSGRALRAHWRPSPVGAMRKACAAKAGKGADGAWPADGGQR